MRRLFLANTIIFEFNGPLKLLQCGFDIVYFKTINLKQTGYWQFYTYYILDILYDPNNKQGLTLIWRSKITRWNFRNRICFLAACIAWTGPSTNILLSKGSTTTYRTGSQCKDSQLSIQYRQYWILDPSWFLDALLLNLAQWWRIYKVDIFCISYAYQHMLHCRGFNQNPSNILSHTTKMKPFNTFFHIWRQ